MSRSSHFVAALAVAALALTPSLADARAGGGSSFGSRGARTYSAPAPTYTAPSTAAPMERSLTPRSAPGYNAPGYGAPMQPGLRPRSGFASGLLGGLLGAGIGGMLFGHGMFGGGGGFGFIGFLLQMALLFFVGRWLFRRFFRPRPMAMAGVGMNGFGRMAQQPEGGGSVPPAPPVTIAQADYAAFDQLLHEVQAAWSAQDLRRLQTLATPEMTSYFAEQLAEQTSRGVRNTVTDVNLEKGDLSEAWAEGNRQYATVAMRFSMVDATRDGMGRLVDGDPNLRTMATELWTFVRAPGGRWLLSAIQQAR